MDGTLLVCPACGLVELSIIARMRVAGDAGAENWLAAISCRHCLFDGVAGLVTGQRGRVERFQHWHVVAREVSAKFVADLQACPAPTSETCACRVHQRYGVVRDGRWTGLDAIPAPSGYRTVCPDPIPIRSADELLALFDNDDGETRCTAIKAAYSFDDPRVADRLADMLNDPWQWAPSSTRNRHHATLELARRGDPRAVEGLIRIVDGDYYHPNFCRRATKALVQFRDPRSFEPLQRLVDREFGGSRADVAASALEAMGQVVRAYTDTTEAKGGTDEGKDRGAVDGVPRAFPESPVGPTAEGPITPEVVELSNDDNGFQCPMCNKFGVQIVATLELPPDGDSDEIQLQLIRCGACDFAGAGTYEESRRGSGESWRHEGCHLPSGRLQELTELLATCPTPGSTGCACPAHQRFAPDDRGHWPGVRAWGARDWFRLRRR